MKRLRAGRRQTEVAKAAKIPIRAYQRYEEGTLPVKRIEDQFKLAAAFNVHVGQLFADPNLVVEPTDDELLKLLDKRLKARTAKPGPDLSRVPRDILEALTKVPESGWLGVAAAISGVTGIPLAGITDDDPEPPKPRGHNKKA